MASYNARNRDPLLDSTTQAALERRSKELIGIALILLGLAAAAMIWSYTPDDPNWMVSTDAPVQNWMGRIGASIAAPLFMIVGWGSWGVALVLIGWGMRFAGHFGEDRAIARLIFAPIWIAVVSVYAATLVPGAEWRATHSYGLGGLFGDTVMGALLTLLPISSHFLVKLMSLAMAVGMIALGIFVLGFTKADVKRGFRAFLLGLVMAYDLLMNLLGRGASATAQAARDRQAQWKEHRAARVEPVLNDDIAFGDPVFEELEEEPEPAPKTGLLARMPSLIRRPEPMPEPELVDPEPIAGFDEMPGEDRIRSKISAAVRNRKVATGEMTPEPDPNLPLTKGRGRRPDPLILNAHQPDELPAEPPVTASGLPPEPPMTAGAAPEWHDPAPVEYAPEAIQGHYAPDPELDDEPLVEDMAEPVPQSRPAMKIPVAEPRKPVVAQPVRRAPPPSRRAQAEAQPALSFEEKHSDFELPPLGLLSNPASIQRHHLSDEALEENARMLENVLDDYGVKGEIVSVRPGPVVTMYELEPAPGLKASRVIGLADDIARSMSALSARVSTLPGRSVIGIELPNENREMVVLREILASRDFGDGNHALPLALGKDIGGESVVANLAKMPHLLIAGTTGSGKSVAINTMILSLLYKLSPDECRLIMIDPKMLELSVYDGIPHLLSPVVTDPKKAVVALKWVVGEMEDRYRKMSKMGVRNIAGYNGRVKDALDKGEMFSRTVQTGFDDETGEPTFETEEFAPEAMPYIVVIVDEMADLMMVAGKEIEACIQRLAQMARASGIHLIMATQRPSVDVITGTIKANFPTRISFQVTSKVDSRTILGEMGAEQLLGQGDMLYMAGGAKITRCHGPFVSDEEVEEIVNHLKQFGPPDYMSGVVDGPAEEKAENIDAVLGLNTGGNTNGEDALYDQAVAIVIKDRKCSTSYIQRKLAIGYNKAARLVEQMEDEGVVSAANHVGKREILVPEQ
ncbi:MULTISPECIES: DNA translocase FtsK [unclassified Ruegeria]|uniref:DNA translocase FtsK n=1 Tax=unclassified Ruegeria TaxID=2625375 RepID=UPI0014889BC7|nr:MULTISPECIES: DNA translocase FtsK [unclassified Ruegeria]NOD49175.1 DNA translocase FtsK [Ruegeria sp. HKCCD5849]NOD51739.1 DNA translocase FtsK [Ruegeria sp. HKCCD5851]NOD68725.1 DNA translocase FtsK [Ruegeria sp. HKCCD7303]NOE35000.1 DNA translocase FtsK [Ruegeria sp. HKCCD7318]